MQDIIERNIKKAADSKAAADFSEVSVVGCSSPQWLGGDALFPGQVVYEAYGVGGTAFVIECLTDNVNRSVTDVKTAVTKGGGKVRAASISPQHSELLRP